MTKKDYIAISRVFGVAVKTFKEDLEERQVEDREYTLSKGAIEGLKMTAEALCVVMKNDNEKFDGYKFMSACGF